MKVRATTKIAIGFVGLIALAYGGSYAYTKIELANVNLDPIPSSDICILAIGPKAGVRDIVANQMVQIIESSGGFKGEGSDEGGAQTGSVKKRIPVKELVEILGGNPESVPPFLKKLKTVKEDEEESQTSPIWSKQDIEKAMAGDAALKSKLEHDLNMSLDGTPLPKINRTAFFDGIRVKTPITLKIPNAKGPTLETYDIVTYRPRFLTQFFKTMQTKFYDDAQLQTDYAIFVKGLTESKEKLDSTFESIFKRSALSEETRKAEQIASNTKILVNQGMIRDMELEQHSVDGKDISYDLKLKLTPEGKNRLWKFSSEGGTKIILVSKGVGIAAATIGTSLNSEELVIKQVPDKTLIEEAVSLIKFKD